MRSDLVNWMLRLLVYNAQKTVQSAIYPAGLLESRNSKKYMAFFVFIS